MSASTSALKKTPLHATHLASGARMVDFGGWEMPVEYSGITDEHLAVRSRAGIFDVSHMGQIELAGPDALTTIQALTTNDAARLAVGQAQYSALTTAEGGFVDDILVYRLAAEHFLLVVNAGNTKKAYAWITGHVTNGSDVSVVNASARYALIALQGPLSSSILAPLTAIDLAALRYYWFAPGEVAGVRVTVSRTGYTGEAGFEIFVPPVHAVRVWDALLDAGREHGIRPCGLGARDTLRLEACMRLYGNDMDETVTVLEAGLEWIVAWQKEPFMGAERLRAEKAAGSARRLVAFEMIDRAIARHGYPVIIGDEPAGVVTSGTQTPTVKKAIGLALVPASASHVGAEFSVEIRGRRARARVVPEPFYKRQRQTGASKPTIAVRES